MPIVTHGITCSHENLCCEREVLKTLEELGDLRKEEYQHCQHSRYTDNKNQCRIRNRGLHLLPYFFLLFAGIGKDYPRDLYDRQFSFYVDNIVARLDLQAEAYGKEEGIPAELFEVYAEQKRGLLALKEVYGSVVTPNQLAEAAVLA